MSNVPRHERRRRYDNPGWSADELLRYEITTLLLYTEPPNDDTSFKNDPLKLDIVLRKKVHKPQLGTQLLPEDTLVLAEGYPRKIIQHLTCYGEDYPDVPTDYDLVSPGVHTPRMIWYRMEYEDAKKVLEFLLAYCDGKFLHLWPPRNAENEIDNALLTSMLLAGVQMGVHVFFPATSQVLRRLPPSHKDRGPLQERVFLGYSHLLRNAPRYHHFGEFVSVEQAYEDLTNTRSDATTSTSGPEPLAMPAERPEGFNIEANAKTRRRARNRHRKQLRGQLGRAAEDDTVPEVAVAAEGKEFVGKHAGIIVPAVVAFPVLCVTSLVGWYFWA